MTESETDSFHVLIRAGRGIRGSIFSVEWVSFDPAPIDSMVLEEEADF